MPNYPVESLLRPIYEYYSFLVYFACAAIAMLVPEALMVVDSVAYTIAIILIARGGMRLWQGIPVSRYQKRLVKIPAYTLASKQIPKSKINLFLGKGFAWTQKHTQRLAETERNPSFTESGALYNWIRGFETRHEKTPLLRKVAEFTRSNHYFNPWKPKPDVGGISALHAVGLLEGEHDVHLPQRDRNGHTLVLGTTRVGKTRFLDLMVRQDIANGDVVIVFDPKGDADLFRAMYSEAINAGRQDDFYFFHLGFPEISARYNPIGNFSRVTEISSRISGQLPGSGQSQAFREFVWRYVNVIAKTLTALGRKADYEQIKFYGEDIEPLFIDYLEFHLDEINHENGEWKRLVDSYTDSFKEKAEGFRPSRQYAERENRSLALMRYYKEFQIDDFIAHSLIKTIEYEKGYLDKLVGSLLPLMEKLCTGKASELLSPDYDDMDDPRRVFDWDEIILTNGIVYIGLDALSDPEVASAVGNSMFADLTATSGRIYKNGIGAGLPTGSVTRRVNVHSDEFNEIIGDEFIPLLNKAGGAGFQVTAYTQTWSDVIARLENDAKAGQVAGNFNNLFLMRVKEVETAEMITGQLKQVEISDLMTISATNDSSDTDDDSHFTSRTEQRISTQKTDLIHPYDLIALPKGQAFALLDGGKPYKIRIPLPAQSDLDNIPHDFVDIAAQMSAQYTTSESWFNFSESFAKV